MKKSAYVFVGREREYLDDESFLESLDPSVRDHVVDLLENPENWAALVLSLPATLIEPIERFLQAEADNPRDSTVAASRLVFVARQVVQIGRLIRKQADGGLNRTAVDSETIRSLRSQLFESWTEWIVHFSAHLAYSFLPAERRRKQRESDLKSRAASRDRLEARKVDLPDLISRLKRSKAGGKSRHDARSIERSRLLCRGDIASRTVSRYLNKACLEVPGWESEEK